ncbi:Vpr/Vpx protein [Halobacillus litoralis]|uniref:Vpr/Vpx protein n=1 Tax=Halobacillus litoralis TaxID=45668 RepID=UPI001CFDCE8F|nr:Vpr/Vpx protein [Halobacillus litoralis]
MFLKNKLVLLLIVMGLVLSACGQEEQSSANGESSNEENASQEEEKAQDSEESTEDEEESKEESKEESEEANDQESDSEFVNAYRDGKNELAKAAEGEEVDYEKVIDLYNNNLQSLVANRDGKIDQQISTALEAGKNGEMDGQIVKQIFDKLTQKVFYLTIKHEFQEISEGWGDKELAEEEIAEAKEFYEVLKETVQKRDAAYETNMVDQIDAGFNEIEKAVADDDKLAFELGKQVVDKTMMKAFYLASGAEPHGYAFKAAKEAKEDAEHAKVEQAEGWAFYQSVSNYVSEYAPEDAAIIEENFNLESDVKELDAEAVNHAFVRGLSKVALHEYEESEEYWGEDKSAITALEGALFIDMIASDIERIQGEETYTTLNEQAQTYLDAVKADEKDKAMEVLSEIEGTLQSIIEEAK